jgi:bacteriocin-like protein
MANLKIYDLHTTDSEIQELSNTSSIKIRNLSINTSEMRQLNNDELQNIVGGSGGRERSFHTVSACPCDQCSPDTVSLQYKKVKVI